MKLELTRSRYYTITKNLDDHPGYKGERNKQREIQDVLGL